MALEDSNGQDTRMFSVAIPTPINRLFTYRAMEALKPGQRVEVPFGRSDRRTIGVVMQEDLEFAGDHEKIKPIVRPIDQVPVYSSVLIELAHWLSHYYMHPIGEVMRTMLPSGGRTKKKTNYALTDKGQELIEQKLDDESEILASIFRRKKTLTEATVLKKLASMDLDSSNTPPTRVSPAHAKLIQQWVKKGLLEELGHTVIQAKSNASDLTWHEPIPATQEPPKTLTVAQKEVFDKIQESFAQGDTKPWLLRGVTGSGKTELYLQLIQYQLESSATAQILVMVPEISLTPQMTRVFEARFADKVVVVHSALSDGERWSRMEAIRSKRAQILIGPRSSVFAPFQNLAFIVVDEEHDGSYKQVTGLCYNGRDVAIVRAKLERIPILLGSATPSMETVHNALQGKYHYAQLNQRAHAKARLPVVELITHDLKKQFGSRLPQSEDQLQSELPVHPQIIKSLQNNLRQGEQSIVILNRRGYAYYLYSLSKKEPVTCPHCSVSLTMHKKSWVLKCHYCDYRRSIKELKKNRPNEVFLTVGYGSEQAEDYLMSQLPGARIARMDSDTTSNKGAMREILDAFRLGEIDVLVGTQMLAKGHDFARVTLICLLETDQILNFPDFRAGERAFQLIVQAAGRAGRDSLQGRVMIQTQKPEHPIIQAAVRQDFDSFMQSECRLRRGQSYPPFSRMISFEWNAPYQFKQTVDQLGENLQTALLDFLGGDEDLRRHLIVLGPASPPIEIVRGRHRRVLILMSSEVKMLRAGANMVWSILSKVKPPVRSKVDVDPQAIL